MTVADFESYVPFHDLLGLPKIYVQSSFLIFCPYIKKLQTPKVVFDMRMYGLPA